MTTTMFGKVGTDSAWTAADAVSFRLFGSAVSEETSAVFVILPGLLGVTVIVRCLLAPLLIVPSVQVTVPKLSVQPGLAETKLTEPGSASVTTTFAASSGPAFAAVNVYVSGSPTVTGSGAAALLKDRSALAAASTWLLTLPLVLPAYGSAVTEGTAGGLGM